MALLVLLMLWVGAAAAYQAHGKGQYVHQRWLEANETPIPIVSIAQGSDGFIWLATGDGLFRFDGVRFEKLEAEQPAKNEAPSAVLVTRSGDVWVALESSHRFAVYRQGLLRVLHQPAAPSRIREMVEGADGAIWALTSKYNAEILRFKGGRWRTFNASDGLPESNASHMILAKDGSLWVAGSAGVAWLKPGAERFEVHRTDSSARVSEDPAGRIWISDGTGTYVVSSLQAAGTEIDAAARFNTGDMDIRGAPLFDRDGNLWVATRSHGVQRFQGVSRTYASEAVTPEGFTSQDGLSSDIVHAIFEDREGSLWVGTERGLDRFRAGTLVQDPALRNPARFGDKLLAAKDGTVYIGQAKTIFRARQHGPPEPIVQTAEEPEGLCEDHAGRLWVALRSEILIWSSSGGRRIPRPDQGARHNFVYDCAFDAQGRYWMSSAGGGVHRHEQGRWKKMFDGGSNPDFYPTTMTATPNGGVVFQSGDRLIWENDVGRVITRLKFGDAKLQVLTLQRSGDHIYIAGAFGVSRWVRGEQSTAWTREISPDIRINGIVETPSGDVWLAYPQALVKLTPLELNHAFADRTLPLPGFSIGRGDGLANRPHSHSQRSMVQGGDGRLWIATQAGTLWMDPSRIARNTIPPGVVITSFKDDVSAQRDPIQPRVRPATSKIEIDFSVLSFVDQQRLEVRYRLEGFDKEWVYPGLRRQAFYTNLPPGTYRFVVSAANSDGVPSPLPATLEFEIPKTFFQSVWFLLLCALLVMAALFFIHRFRVAQEAGRVKACLEERNAERERISRELHDTLLQGVMGLILRFQAVANRITHEPSLRSQLESALSLADAVVADARRHVGDLRGSRDAEDLLPMMERIVADAQFATRLPVRILVEGRQRPLHPLVSMEIGKILGEALLNASQHSSASSAEIAIGFELRHLAVRFRDDGVGIPPDVVSLGHREGHYGLVGMRERAERIGGTLSIISGAGQGTEVTLVLPGKLAYSRRSHKRMRWSFRAPWRKSNE